MFSSSENSLGEYSFLVSVSIITKGKPTGEMIDKLMAPYAKWDYYQIGGRYAGCIRVNKETAVDYGYGEKSWDYRNNPLQ